MSSPQGQPLVEGQPLVHPLQWGERRAAQEGPQEGQPLQVQGQPLQVQGHARAAVWETFAVWGGHGLQACGPVAAPAGAVQAQPLQGQGLQGQPPQGQPLQRQPLQR